MPKTLPERNLDSQGSAQLAKDEQRLKRITSLDQI